MKRSLIDAGLYADGLKQLRPMGITAGVLVFLGCTVPALAYAARSNAFEENYLSSLDYGFFSNIAPALFVLIFIVSTALVYRAFSFLTQRNASDFYHSLPLTRTCLFASLTASVLTGYSASPCCPLRAYGSLCRLTGGY